VRVRGTFVVALVALGVPTLGRGQAGLLVPTRTGRPDARVLSLREMSIDVGIARGYARVNVRQVFENRTGDVQEGTYRFRLPPSAAIGDFAVWDDLVRIPGVILEKRRARAIYQELTTQRIDPGLLQQGEEDEGGTRPSGGAAFSAKVAPVPPHATKRLEIQFQEEVPFIAGRGEFRLALRPPDGEPPVAARLAVRVSVADADAVAGTGGLPLAADAGALVLTGTDVPLDRDLVVSLSPRGSVPLRLSAFRNADGALPDGLALAPWERASELPPERDGFFLLELTPPQAPTATGPRPAAKGHPPVTLGLLFDTSLSHRFAGLEKSYASLVRLLQSLTPRDRFALVAFDRTPVVAGALGPATLENVEAALIALRGRPLGAGSDVAKAVAEGRRVVGDSGRLVLLTDGPAGLSSAALSAAKGPLPLFAALAGEETPESIRTAAHEVLSAGATSVEEDLFFERAVGPLEKTAARAVAELAVPFRVSGGEPRVRDVYPVLVQPPSPGSLSGWIGRYAAPEPHLRFDFPSPMLKEGHASLEAALPEKAIEARDLPRRWARARVDHLLALIELEGEKREWVDEIIALSKRYKFVTPYTAFLAAPRSLLRPRRIQPGDPVLRVECDPTTVSAVALLPFGLRLPLVRRPGSHVFEGRFLVPEGLKDGSYTVRIVLRDAAGGTASEVKRFVIDGHAPTIAPEVPRTVHPGEALRVAVRTDDDVIVLEARLGDGAPVPLRWDEASKRSVGFIHVPSALIGAQAVFIEAVDAAKNRGFARALVEVRP
jgi:Ca-activated chloride channel family protein